MRALRFLPLLALLLPVACTTVVDDPGAYRNQKSTTIGFPGVMYNATRSTAIGMQLNVPKSESLTVNSGETGDRATSRNSSATSTDGSTKVGREAWSVDAFTMFYPSSKSFFYFGLGVNAERSRGYFDAKTQGFSLDGAMTNVEWIDETASVFAPIGISVNTKEGITSVAGIGPKLRVANNRKFVFDGGDRSVDAAARDATLESYDDSRDGLGYHLQYMVGYSF